MTLKIHSFRFNLSQKGFKTSKTTNYQILQTWNCMQNSGCSNKASEGNIKDINRRVCLFSSMLGMSQLIPLNQSTWGQTAAGDNNNAMDVRNFDGDGFFMQIPAEMDLIEASNINGEPNSPLRAKLELPSGLGNVVVVTKEASKLKQLFFQVQDISDLGSPSAVASLVLPPKSYVKKISVKTIKRENIETLLGVVEQPPQNIYRYEFTNPQGKHFLSAVAATKGQIFILAASGDEQKWDEVRQFISVPVNTFRLLLAT
eukprot:TRINITY_DN28664_c0_g1_i1.p1 TRINITY_DN28664_c0_g1~~TRINITY_DN28664_c0_g1_i1.p1  ORF type:complete len:288 (+),score=14.86 TRINITY_DN28664_c0_g1_i1:92-865(+)